MKPKRITAPQSMKVKKFKSQMSEKQGDNSFRSPERVAAWAYADVYREPQAQTVVRRKDLQKIGHSIDNWSPSDGRDALKQAILGRLSKKQLQPQALPDNIHSTNSLAFV